MVIASLGIALLAFVSPVDKVYAEEYAVVGISDDGEAEAEGTEYSLGDSVKGIVSPDGTTLTVSGTGVMKKTAANAGIDTSKLTTVIFEEGITTIANGFLKDCRTLSCELKLPSTLTYIGISAFGGCYGLTGDLIIPEGVTWIDEHAFSGCSGFNGDLVIPGTCKDLKKGAFYNTGFKNLYLEEGVERIEMETFRNCKFSNPLVIPDSMVHIWSYGFSYCPNIPSVDFGDGIQIIGDGAFFKCTSLAGIIKIPDSVTTIGKETFSNDNGISMIKGGENVASLGVGAFYATVSVDTSVMTTNELLKTYDWAGSNRVYIEVSPENFHGVSMTGDVSPVTTIDVTLPLNGLSFAIDENRNFSAQTSVIQNNCNCPIDVYLLDISKNSNEPDVVAENTYTEKEWNNLSKADTLSKIALKVNDQELFTIFNNSERDGDLALKVGSIKSGFTSTEELELTPGAQYGKNFGNKELIKFQYDLVFEFRVP